jgi:hypothetical protein
MHHGNMVSLGKSIDCLDVFITDLAEGSRRRNPEFPLPTQERAYLPYGLQLRYVCLKKNAVDRTTPECYMITKQRAIICHHNLSALKIAQKDVSRRERRLSPFFFLAV